MANMPWVLEKGILCRSSPDVSPSFVNIGNADLITKRAGRAVPEEPGGTLSDYVPFYFTPCSVMLLNILTGRNVPQRSPEEIAMLVSSVANLQQHGVRVLVTDRHASMEVAKFSKGADGLASVDWSILQNRDFRRDPDDPGKMERYQAEALAHGKVPIEALLGIACFNTTAAERLQEMQDAAGTNVKVVQRPDWFFR